MMSAKFGDRILRFALTGAAVYSAAFFACEGTAHNSVSDQPPNANLCDQLGGKPEEYQGAAGIFEMCAFQGPDSEQSGRIGNGTLMVLRSLEDSVEKNIPEAVAQFFRRVGKLEDNGDPEHQTKDYCSYVGGKRLPLGNDKQGSFTACWFARDNSVIDELALIGGPKKYQGLANILRVMLRQEETSEPQPTANSSSSASGSREEAFIDHGSGTSLDASSVDNKLTHPEAEISGSQH